MKAAKADKAREKARRRNRRDRAILDAVRVAVANALAPQSAKMEKLIAEMEKLQNRAWPGDKTYRAVVPSASNGYVRHELVVTGGES